MMRDDSAVRLRHAGVPVLAQHPEHLEGLADGSLTLELPGPQGFFNSINYGRIVIEFSPDGMGTIIKQTGHAEDICAALAQERA